ncbi:uncharacterized protein LOC132560901 [Ylistrum balloti]|uniref:uncharacterized protein LOC132560901 n=1 Tax=Ylistrum balloti TaxID=509963 RepID=UPI002905B8D7|nr:uncharacterized protein LOC132560901 [Ylistrum balloti]
MPVQKAIENFQPYISKSFLKSVIYATFPGAICYILTSNHYLSRRVFFGVAGITLSGYLYSYGSKEMKKIGLSVKDLVTMDDE